MSKMTLRNGASYTMLAKDKIPKTPDEKRKKLLPYGIWTCADGREILFNRFYEPIWQRRPGEAIEEADRNEYVAEIRQERWFYKDGTKDKAGAARRALRDWMSR